MFSGQQNVGMNAAAGITGANQNYANNATNIYGNMGDAMSAGAVSNQNQKNQGIATLADLFSQGFGNSQYGKSSSYYPKTNTTVNWNS